LEPYLFLQIAQDPGTLMFFKLTDYMYNRLLNLLLLLPVFFLANCVGKRKIAKMTVKLEDQKKIQYRIDSSFGQLQKFREKKYLTGELDDSSNSSIKILLDKEKDVAINKIDSLNHIAAELQERHYKLKSYKNLVIEIANGKTTESEKTDLLEYIDQLLKQQTFIRFNTGAFFPPGGYIIPPEKFGEARIAFSPLIDSLFNFVNKFPKMKLNSSVITCGYADGSGFAPGPLVDTLNNYLGKSEATKEELNTALSRLRTESVNNILLLIFKDKLKELQTGSKLKASFYKIGKGEEYPNKSITDYQLNDERRRIVVLFWNALPE
jgi:superoxide dismutase